MTTHNNYCELPIDVLEKDVQNRRSGLDNLKRTLAHKEQLLDVPSGEHSHVVHDLHKQFSESLEGFVEAFLDEHGATMEQFVGALREQQDSGDLCTRMTVEVVTDEIFALME